MEILALFLKDFFMVKAEREYSYLIDIIDHQNKNCCTLERECRVFVYSTVQNIQSFFVPCRREK
jgi:hypothetical protein